MTEATQAAPSEVIDALQNLKGTVSFTRKVNDGNYGTNDAFMAMQFDVPANMDADKVGAEIIKRATDAFFACKAVVFDQLGIEAMLDDSGVLVEVVTKAFPGTVHESAPAPSQPSAAVAAAAPAPAAGEVNATTPWPASKSAVEIGRNGKERSTDEFTAWAKERFQVAPQEFFDNRSKKASGEYKAGAPDIKHKDTKAGVWL